MATREEADYESLFPAKLHYALEQAENDGLGDIIAWRPHGRAFLVLDRRRFEAEFLPNWFQQRHWSSFQRQLNHYDFKRISTGRDRNAYYHPCFIRGKRELCRHIFRAKIKGAGPRKANRPDEEPDFYGPGFADPVAPARAEAVAPDRAASSASAADPAMRRFPQAVGRHALHPLLQLPPTIDAGIVSRQVSGSSSGSSSALFDGFDGSIAVRPAGPLLLGALWPQHSHLATAPAPAAAALPLLVGMPRLPALAAAAVIRNPGAGWLSYTPFLQPQHQQPRHSFPARKHRLPPALQAPAPLPLPLPQPRFAAVDGASSALPRPRPPPGPLPPAPASLPPPASQLTRRSLDAISARDRSDSSSEN